MLVQALYYTMLYVLAASSGRMHGIGDSYLRILSLPALGIALLMGSASLGWGWAYTLPTVAIALWAFATGHGNAYHMGTLKDYPIRHQKLDYVILPLSKLLGFENRSTGYCWLFMGFKGLLIGLPLGLVGLLLTVLWPLAYWISFKRTASNTLAEYISTSLVAILTILLVVT